MLFADIDEIIDGTPEEKPQTNADRIRAMSDEELAALLTEGAFRPDAYFPIDALYKIRLAWLKQPADLPEGK